MGDRDFLVRGQGHAIFIDGERDHGRTIALGHWQDLRRALLAIFQVDGVDDGLAGNTLQRFFDDVGLGRVDQDGRGYASGDLFEDAFM